MMDASLPDLRGEHRAEPIQQNRHRLVADIRVTLEQKRLLTDATKADSGHASSRRGE
jgi:hypothetical protein